MLLNLEIDPTTHSACALSYNEQERWLQAVWRGYVNPVEAMRGAEAYLQHAAHQPSTYLFNDNSDLRGPWFESLDWLVHVWVPQAERIGLRYVAHVVQADRHQDIFTSSHAVPLPFELQLFQSREDAQHWLRGVRDANAQASAAPAAQRAASQ